MSLKLIICHCHVPALPVGPNNYRTNAELPPTVKQMQSVRKWRRTTSGRLSSEVVVNDETSLTQVFHATDLMPLCAEYCSSKTMALLGACSTSLLDIAIPFFVPARVWSSECIRQWSACSPKWGLVKTMTLGQHQSREEACIDMALFFGVNEHGYYERVSQEEPPGKPLFSSKANLALYCSSHTRMPLLKKLVGLQALLLGDAILPRVFLEHYAVERGGERVLPTRLTHMTFHCWYNKRLLPGMLPRGLTHLRLHKFFQVNLAPNCLPDTLTHFCIHVGRYSPLEAGVLPNGLARLCLRGGWGPINVDSRVFPPSLQVFAKGDNITLENPDDVADDLCIIEETPWVEHTLSRSGPYMSCRWWHDLFRLN